MSDNWYLSRSGQRHGPYTAEQLKKGIAKGQVQRTDLLWQAGMEGWARASTIHEFFATDSRDVERTSQVQAPPPPRLPSVVDLDVERTVPRKRAALKPASPPNLDVESTIPRSRPPTHVAVPSASSRPALPPQPAPSGGNGIKVGDMLGKFLITKTLGRGGMGVVYKATDTETEVEYAVKVLTPELVTDLQVLADFKKEVAIAQALTHQNLLKVNYMATWGSIAYIVMEYIDGENLEEFRVSKGGNLSLDEFRRIAPQVLAGLEYLHEKGVVHLDIKPLNIMLTNTGEVKITDYGMARTIKEQLRQNDKSDTPTGTLCYMAPEQLRPGAVCDRRTDIYAVGIMFHLLVVGRYPFTTLEREHVVRWHIDPLHTTCALDTAHLSEIIQRALRVEPSERWSSCQAMLEMLTGGQQLPLALPTSNSPPLIVSKLGPEHFHTIGEAIQKACPGTRILVRPGIYSEAIVLDKSVELVGVGSVSDVIVQNATGGYCLTMRTDYAVVKNLTLRGRAAVANKSAVTVHVPQGRLVLERCDVSSDSDASIFIHGTLANPDIRFCEIHDTASGSGVHCDEQSEGVVEE